jgi:hypothetical protein
MSTTKTIERLRTEVSVRIDRLGGIVKSFQPGEFVIGDKKRLGYRIYYFIESPSGEVTNCRLDVAALPVRVTYRNSSTEKKRAEASLKMALYMLEIVLAGIWFMERLSPGYSPMLPFVLVDGERTVSDIWNESSKLAQLMPGKDSDFVEGSYVVKEEN